MYHQPTIFCFSCRDLRLAMVFGPSHRGTLWLSQVWTNGRCIWPTILWTNTLHVRAPRDWMHWMHWMERSGWKKIRNSWNKLHSCAFKGVFFSFEIVSMLFGIPEVTHVFQDKLKQATASKISTKISCRCDGPSIIQILCDPFPSSCFGVGELHGHPGLRLQAKLG